MQTQQNSQQTLAYQIISNPALWFACPPDENKDLTHPRVFLRVRSDKTVCAYCFSQHHTNDQ